MNRRTIFLSLLCWVLYGLSGKASTLPIIEDVEVQPFSVHVRNLIDAMESLGTPFGDSERNKLKEALRDTDERRASRQIQQVLDRRCLAGLRIQPNGNFVSKASPLAGKAELIEGGWRQFLVKVHNEAESGLALALSSPDAFKLSGSPAEKIDRGWLDLGMFGGRPLQIRLSGIKLEYRIISLYSRDRGKRSTELVFSLSDDSKAIPRKTTVSLGFDCLPANEVSFSVLDENNRPTFAAFEILDEQGRLYPSPAKRLEPDFSFQPQVYRGDGETITLPDGTYTVRCRRGPESIPETKKISISRDSRNIRYQVRRWVNPSGLGWWSGDHHIHAAGCLHYSSPTQGVSPKSMIRHCIGEDLNVGSVLTWGPCFDHQLKFFTGRTDKVSRAPYLLRYDIEVSGFGSHQSGHLCLLRLKERNYPGGKSKHHWPTLGLNTLRWAKRQGAITGPAHSASGLTGNPVGFVEGEDGPDGLPSYAIPPYDGIGANEYIVDVTHKVPGPDGKPVPAVDFISTMDTDRRAELNMWYHTLNCGFRVKASGETDFPCISGQRVGLGRVYVKVDGKLTYDNWCDGIQNGRSYVSDGLSHLLEFSAFPSGKPKNAVAVGEDGGTLRLEKPGKILLKVKSASRFRGGRMISSSITGNLTERLTQWEESIRNKLGNDEPLKARLGRWFSMGPFQSTSFDKAFEHPFPPEREFDAPIASKDSLKNLKGNQTDKEKGSSKNHTGELTWREQSGWKDGEIQSFPGQNCATYVSRVIKAETKGTMLLSLGSNDAIKVWVNRKLVWSNLIQRATAPGQDMVLIDLEKGDNRLLMKIVNGSGGHGFYFKRQHKVRPDYVMEILRTDPKLRTKEQIDSLTHYYVGLDPELLGVEAVVNGYPVDGQFILSDGKTRDLEFVVDVKQSSWVAVRIFPSAHTNPIWIEVAGKPVRASRRSAEWCLRGVDQCWSQKSRFYAKEEKEDAKRAYEHARRVYRKILAECKTP